MDPYMDLLNDDLPPVYTLHRDATVGLLGLCEVRLNGEALGRTYCSAAVAGSGEWPALNAEGESLGTYATGHHALGAIIAGRNLCPVDYPVTEAWLDELAGCWSYPHPALVRYRPTGQLYIMDRDTAIAQNVAEQDQGKPPCWKIERTRDSLAPREPR
jgi:hypothetical protein